MSPTPTRALVVVPPFLKVVSGPMLGPALLAGAGRAAGHFVDVVDLNAAWLAEHVDGNALVAPSPFVGDHDRPTEALRTAQRRWSAMCGAVLPAPAEPQLAEDPALTLMVEHDQVLAAASALAAGELGVWVHDAFAQLAAPRVVGVSVMYSGQVLAAMVVADVARRLWPGVLVVWGGAHVTALREVLPTDRRFGRYAAGFVIGYAERTWVNVLDAVAADRPVPPEVARAGEGPTIRATEDPAVVPWFGAQATTARTLPAQASRGCAYGKCAFCTYPAVEGKYRAVALDPTAAVVDEAAGVGARVSFKDSLVVPGRLEALAELIRGRVRWSACTKLHPRLDTAFLTRLAAGGCATLEIGLETLTPAGQLVIDKRQSMPLFLSFLDAAERAGIAVVVNYITGFPGTDPDEEQEWLQRVQAELATRPGLVAKVEHNTFQLERMSPMGQHPERYGLSVIRAWPWASVLAWATSPRATEGRTQFPPSGSAGRPAAP